MKNTKKIIASILALALTVTCLPTDTVKAESKPKLNKTKVTLEVGETVKLKVKKASGLKTKWKSSKPKVAAVSKKGKVTAKSVGSTKIKVTITTKDNKKIKLKTKVKVIEGKVASPATTPAVSVPSTIPAITVYVVVSFPPAGRPEDQKTNEPVADPSHEPTTSPAVTPPTEPTKTPDTDPAEKPTVTPTVTPTSTPTLSPNDNVLFQGDVTYAMTNAKFWADKSETADDVIMTAEQIKEINESVYKDASTNTYDLKNFNIDNFNAESMKTTLKNDLISVRDDYVIGRGKTMYVEGKAVDTNDYFDDIFDNVSNADTTGFTTRKLALVVKRTGMRSIPTADCVGWSATDPDDEFMNTGLNINDPMIVSAITADGKFAFGICSYCSGWVATEDIAICDDKETWLSMWNTPDKETLVVNTNHITLDASISYPESSKLELYLGTTLPIVSSDNIPANIGERNTWYNHVVYVPARDDEGKLVKAYALIPMNAKVNAGYLDYTERNVLETAFTCLGDRYGWGGMLDAMDCSLYMRQIYKCFGFDLPRNTTWQARVPGYVTNISGKTDEEKTDYIRTCMPGTILIFSSHEMMYLGEADGKLYVISDLGSLVESESANAGDDVKTVYGVAINSLDVRRGNGRTWLNCLENALELK